MSKLRPEYEKIVDDVWQTMGPDMYSKLIEVATRCQELAADKQGEPIALLRVSDSGVLATLIADNGKTLPAGEYYVYLSSLTCRDCRKITAKLS